MFLDIYVIFASGLRNAAIFHSQKHIEVRITTEEFAQLKIAYGYKNDEENY